MKGTIPASNVGNFSSVAQKRLYDAGQKVQQAALQAADRFVQLDESAGDANRGSRGSVLLDGYGQETSLTGVCRFEPASRRINQLDAEIASDVRLLSMDYVAPRREAVRIETTADGVTYATGGGTMRLNADGSIFVDTDARLQPGLLDGAPLGGTPEVATVRESYAAYMRGQ